MIVVVIVFGPCVMDSVKRALFLSRKWSLSEIRRNFTTLNQRVRYLSELRHNSGSSYNCLETGLHRGIRVVRDINNDAALV